MPTPSETTFVRPRLRSHRSLSRRVVQHWPFFAWIAIAALAAFFYLRSTQYGALPGTAQMVNHDLSPLQIGVVKEIFVKIGDAVTNGQVVAQMDTTIVDAQVAEADAALAAAQGSWAAYEEQMLTLVQTCDNEISSAAAMIAQQEGQRDSQIAKLAELKTIQAKRDELFKNKLINETEEDAFRPEIAGLEKEVASYPSMISMYRSTLERRKKEREDLQRSLRVGPDGDVQKAISLKTAAQTEILKVAADMKRLERETYSLKSRSDGIVSSIGVLPGATAKPGDNVVTVVSGAHAVIGYLPEVRRGLLKVGDWGYAFRLTLPPVRVQVVAVAPEIDPIPVKSRPTTAAQQSGVTFRAQRIVFRTEGPSDLAPGESLQIRITSDFWAKIRYRLGFQW